MSEIRRVGVLTSGGDAPGMNAAIRAVVRDCVRNGVTPVGVRRGYNGLIHADLAEMEAKSVNGITSKGGTILYTARCEDFLQHEGVELGVRTCKYMGLDALICIGGDGTFMGAYELSKAGITVVGIPGTIDNDIGCCHYTIGFDTAANTAINAIDKLSDTMQSHERVSVVEIMGRRAGHLAVYVGLAVGATSILIPEIQYDFNKDIIEKIREGRYTGKHHFLIIVAEGIGKCDELAARVHDETGLEARVSILGYIQRGGSPSVRDRVMASRMGYMAVEEIVAGRGNSIICYRDSRLIATPIAEAMAMTKKLDPYMYQVAQNIAL
ncbi:MAG TPA: ATP-dependent 6-phosphofructokinase [Eubacteriales bacterium]|nr:ATP-dependent 6-phosphofructokinase [Clostridia bacterium]HRV72948.1 ATP-dependent 6-phosphofructokinase [Eubacteriales bacterium]